MSYNGNDGGYPGWQDPRQPGQGPGPFGQNPGQPSQNQPGQFSQPGQNQPGQFGQPGQKQPPQFGQFPGGPGYGGPGGQYPPQPAPSGKGFALTALILGIVAIVLAFIPFVNFVTYPLGVAAIIFGIIALVTRRPGKGMSITGIVLAGVSFIVAIIAATIFFVAFAAHAVQQMSDYSSDYASDYSSYYSSYGDSSEQADSPHQIKYLVTSNGDKAEMVTFTKNDIDQDADFTKNWDLSFTAEDTEEYLGTRADPKDPTEHNEVTFTCEILIDGKSAVKHSGTGSVACEGYVEDLLP